MRRSINASVLGKLTTLIYKANSECFWLEFVNVSCYVTSFIATNTKYIQYVYEVLLIIVFVSSVRLLQPDQRGNQNSLKGTLN